MDYDAELKLLNPVLRRAFALRRDDGVLDVGCGRGRTTREAAREAPDGRAVGIDHSAAMVDRARELAEAEGIHNVTFVHGDAQTHRFAPESFDVAISRFGTMFFGDPVSAFANVGRALCRGGRLVMMVWQAHEENEWSVAVGRALAGQGASPLPARPGLDPFSLADPQRVTGVLEAAGFTDVSVSDVRQPVYYGPDLTTAFNWVSGFTSTADALGSMDQSSREEALERLRESLAAHATEDGIWFDARAWIVTARRGT